MQVRYCVTAWIKCASMFLLYCSIMRPHVTIYTPAVHFTHTQPEQIGDTTERNLQMDLTFTGLDNQITREIEEGLQGAGM